MKTATYCQRTALPEEKSRFEGESMQKNVQAAAEVFSEYSHEIRTFIRYNVHDESLAEDVYQEFFLSLVSCPLPVGIGNMKRFLYRAITNDILTMVSRSKRRREHLINYMQFSRSKVPENDPAHRTMGQEDRAKVLHIIEKHLHPREYKAIQGRMRFGKDNERAAQDLGIKKRSYIRYLSLGLKKIRNLNLKYEEVWG